MLLWLDSPKAVSRQFVLLDRDGIINENRPDYVKNFGEFQIYPDAMEAIALLNRKEVSVIIISNQSGVNRGLISWDEFWNMHCGMIQQVEEHGGKILAAFYCPHRPDENCQCRKPKPAMVHEACRLFGISPRSLVFMGDRDSDMEAARNAGCVGVRILRETHLEKLTNSGKMPIFSGLMEAVLSIFGQHG